ncbi:MAG: Gfo/Idh/MocA family oxidoreductase [Victivallaceae bacterium]|nr:Gfo/Idh/MocA family oxidoreductase [Victivallaceae bacterium]
MNQRLRVGVWGLGRAGLHMHCPELLRFPEMFEIGAGCDVLADHVALFHTMYTQSACYTDGEAFLRDRSLDVIAVAVPSLLHVEYTKRALAAGKIVFLEKPFALSLDEIAELRRLDREYPGRLYFRLNRRFEACFNHVREIISSGVLGEIFEIKLRRHNFQFRDDWQTLKSCGGGQLNNWGPHLVDHSLLLLESEPAAIWSDVRRVAAVGDADDHIKLVFRGVNGRVIDLEISGGVAVPSPVYEVYGKRGTLFSKDEKTIELKYLDPNFAAPTGPAHKEPPPPETPFFAAKVQPQWVEKSIAVAPANGMYMEEIYRYLYMAIRDNVPFPVTTRQALRVMEVIAGVQANSLRAR